MIVEKLVHMSYIGGNFDYPPMVFSVIVRVYERTRVVSAHIHYDNEGDRNTAPPEEVRCHRAGIKTRKEIRSKSRAGI